MSARALTGLGSWAGRRTSLFAKEPCNLLPAVLLFASAVFCNNQLRQPNATLEPGEALIAYFDDVYILTRPERARAAFDAVTRVIEDRAGIRRNMGKCVCWNAQRGDAAPGIAELGGEDDKVWRGDGAAEERGLIILGNPVGTAEFIQHDTQKIGCTRNKLSSIGLSK